MADSDLSRSALAVVLDRLAGLEARQREATFESLRAAVLGGKDDAWRRFVEKYSRFTYTVALRLLAGAPDREEAAAGIYARVFERLAAREHRLLRSFQGRCRFTSYLYRMVQSERKEHFRRAGADAGEPLEDAAVEDASSAAPQDPVVRPEAVREAVRSAVAELEPGDRLLLLSRFRDGLKLREIAEWFGFRDTNVAARAVQAALRRMKPIEAFRRESRPGEAEYAALERALRDHLFRPGAAGGEGDR